MKNPRVTFGIINCNRLFYLKSCVESLVETTKDYDNKEIFIVDNASVENGTEEYLNEKEAQGIKIFRNSKRDPSNEFAKALNLITRESTGEYIAHIQGDMQFVLGSGWLTEYIQFYESFKKSIGCIGLDAQRTQRNRNTSKFSDKINPSYPFLVDFSRIPFSCSADVLYSRESLEFMGPFLEKNEGHERGVNSEDDMRQRMLSKIKNNSIEVYCAMPLIPPACGIFTDSRGTNARVRGNRLYGDYWEAKSDFRYYEIKDYKKSLFEYTNREFPVGIEEMAFPIGWDAPIDNFGNWKKNPIRIETATSDDWVEIYPEESESPTTSQKKDTSYISEWLED